MPTPDPALRNSLKNPLGKPHTLAQSARRVAQRLQHLVVNTRRGYENGLHVLRRPVDPAPLRVADNQACTLGNGSHSGNVDRVCLREQRCTDATHTHLSAHKDRRHVRVHMRRATEYLAVHVGEAGESRAVRLL